MYSCIGVRSGSYHKLNNKYMAKHTRMYIIFINLFILLSLTFPAGILTGSHCVSRLKYKAKETFQLRRDLRETTETSAIVLDGHRHVVLFGLFSSYMLDIPHLYHGGGSKRCGFCGIDEFWSRLLNYTNTCWYQS